jgi:hypothetical protein
MAEGDSAVVDAQDPPSLLVSLPTLSNGFIGQVASPGTDQEAPANPILQVFSCEIIYEASGYKKGHQNMKRCRLVLLDGSDQYCIGVTVTSLLYTAQTQLTNGEPIIHLSRSPDTTMTRMAPRERPSFGNSNFAVPIFMSPNR